MSAVRLNTISRLGDRRAAATKDALVALGVPATS